MSPWLYIYRNYNARERSAHEASIRDWLHGYHIPSRTSEGSWQAWVIQPHVQTCLGRLLILQKGWNVCDNISWHLFMWWSEPVNAMCCRLSKGQRWPWREACLNHDISWQFITKGTILVDACAGFFMCAVTNRPFKSLKLLWKETLPLMFYVDLIS